MPEPDWKNGQPEDDLSYPDAFHSGDVPEEGRFLQARQTRKQHPSAGKQHANFTESYPDTSIRGTAITAGILRHNQARRNGKMARAAMVAVARRSNPTLAVTMKSPQATASTSRPG
jgi:hypothetical protein